MFPRHDIMRLRNEVSRTLPSLGDLEAFEATAKFGTVSRAAIELHLTQSAVSRKVMALEARLGVTLFERTRKRLILTTAGARYLATIGANLSALEHATDALRRNDPQAGELHVATLPTLGAMWLTPRLGSFLKEHPGLDLTLSTRVAPFDFAIERIDAAIHFGHPEWPGARLQFLAHEETVVVAAPGLLDASSGLEQIADLPLIYVSSRPLAWPVWFAAVGADSRGRGVGVRVEAFSMGVSAAIAGLGAAVLPRFVVEADLEAGRLTALPGSRVQGSSAYYLATPEARTPTPWVVAAFSNWLAERFRRDVPSGVI